MRSPQRKSVAKIADKVFKPISSALSAEEYRMLRVFAALDDKNLGQIIRVAVQEFLEQRKLQFKG